MIKFGWEVAHVRKKDFTMKPSAPEAHPLQNLRRDNKISLYVAESVTFMLAE